jgi:hypothetical protein
MPLHSVRTTIPIIIYLYNLATALTWRHNKKRAIADIREAAKLYHELLLLCPKDTYLRSIAEVSSDCKMILLYASH